MTTEMKINYYTDCARQKPWVVTVNWVENPLDNVRFLKSERRTSRRHRIFTTDVLVSARGFTTEENAQAWIDEHKDGYNWMVFGVANRRNHAKKMLAQLSEAVAR